jgi:hypothetical protein
MEPGQKAAALTEILKMRLEKYKQTRDLQFKVNIALWTLIILIGYKCEKTLDLENWSGYLIFGIIALAVSFCHYYLWLRPVSESMARDSAIALRLQNEVENIVLDKSDEPERDLDEISRSYYTMNLFLAGITLLLMILLGIFLAL